MVGVRGRHEDLTLTLRSLAAAQLVLSPWPLDVLSSSRTNLIKIKRELVHERRLI